MADQGQLQRLKAGVKDWNQWRIEQPSVPIDFSHASLLQADLRTVDLSNADLTGADLRMANLAGANLREAELRNADLSKGFYRLANFSGANLREAWLDEADLYSAYLGKADLQQAQLLKAYLCDADFQEANLMGADIRGAYLGGANLQKSNLSKVDLSSADLGGADLRGADLRYAKLEATSLLDANLASAQLTGACVQDWNTSTATIFVGALADYVYWKIDEDGQFFDRRPHSGNFKPGEFAALFQQALDTLDLIFVDGIDWQSFFASFQELRQQYGDANLNIQAIEKKSGGSFVVKLEVNEQADKTAIEQSAKAIYEENQQLKAQLFRTEGKLEGYKEQLSDFQQKVLQGMSDKTVINNNMQGATVGNMANQLSGNASQIYNTAQDKSLAEAAQEIQALLDQLSKTYPSETRREKFDLAEVAAEQAKANLTLWQRIVSAIDAGMIGAVGEMLSHPVATFFIDAAQDLAETKPQA